MVEEKPPEIPELPVPAGRILTVPVTGEMEKAYLDYAMSVIVARALPDVRDGLKPVQRRIIYAMHEQGMGPTTKFSKCAAVVGEVMKKFHPHGDLSIYDALVRMAQEFSMRYRLVDGQGNFGSIDGDSPAAMRYTECRLAPITDELLSDIDKETVLFGQNYDATTTEPTVLPAAVPNLLLNGSSGIAVGMATNIPPHNLGEILDALVAMVQAAKVSGEVDQHQADYNLTVEDLMQFVPGPDFPTAALVYGQDEIARGYATGKGSAMMRAKTEITEEEGKNRIITTELPYQVNKATLLERIAQLVKDGKVKGIGGLRDESDREGIRVVVDLKKEARPQAVLNYLFKHTELQTTFHMNMVALVDGQPQTLTLKAILEEFLKHRYEVVLKRTRFLLGQAKQREHILQGLKIALDHLDEVIATIKKSADTDDARANLVKKFGLTEIQAQAILDMPLKRLSALEREKIEQELKDILEEIKRLDLIISKPQNIYREVEKELQEVKETYGDERRTKIFKKRIGEFSEEELVPEEDVIVTITESGYIKRLGTETYKRQMRGGKGVIGMKTKDEDVIWQMLPTSTHDEILFFTNKGRVYKLKTYEIPEGSRQAKGAAVVNVLDLESEEKVVVMLPISKKKEQPDYLFMATDHGTVKKTALTDFENIRRTGIMAIRLKPGENLIWVKQTSGENDIALVTKMGQSIRFKEKDVRSMGRAAAGVRGIKLAKGDQVISTEVVINPKDYLLTISERGVGKRTPLAQYKTQNRGGSGILTHRVTAKTGKLVSARIVEETAKKDLLLMSEKAQVIRLPVKQVPILGRATQGVYLMRLNEGDSVSAVVFLEAEVEIEEAVKEEGKEEGEEE
ncbi:DNA gyrase subunit A [candidate division WWE3 bacterium RBG_19FT_COMBO_53_11]|uniref:DNA gyrase subunit A n=1 Tax=candidate division WWE3 bacterium RBG_19FT_COMBO_53_11 TaxID=1802613 RepID=A0A1F4UIV7_UNCKA|nr:MAG: DNA gyrase subunit A [candidate division WWE3 bacterium RBG_16_52_45]OGC44849.1 MAG: DNA gyrase subunit A [candidate division WWE3 bacterium RBG_19FT_COMBO_53_11]